MKKYLGNDYNYKDGASIIVPRKGHTQLNDFGDRLTTKTKLEIVNPNTKSPVRSVIARDISELRRVYPEISNRKLQELIQLNKNKYPDYMRK